MLEKAKGLLKRAKWYLVSLLVALLFAVSCGMATYTGLLETIDNLLTDMIYRQMGEGDDVPIRIISIDEATVERLGKVEDWSRSISADIVKILNSRVVKPVIIGIDLLYDEEKDQEGDMAFVRACRAANVCLIAEREKKEPIEGGSFKEQENGLPKGAAEAGEQEKGLEFSIAGQDGPAGSANSASDENGSAKPSNPALDNEGIEEPAVRYPYEGIRTSVQIGLSDSFAADGSGVIRETMLHADIDEETSLDSFAVVLYKAYQRHAGKSYQLDRGMGSHVRFNYSRSSNEYKTYSFIDVLDGKVDVSEFANTIVIIGDSTTQNHFRVPNQQGGWMQDIILQANAVEAMLSQKVVYKLPSLMLAAAYGVIILAFYYIIFGVKRKRWSIVMAILLLIIHFQIGYYLSDHGYYLPVLPLWIFAFFAIMAGMVIGYYREKETALDMQKVLETYVEPQVVEQILEKNNFDVRLGGEKKNIAVLFVDIRGFTSLSEVLPPEQIVGILNEYLDLVAHAVFENEGTLDKFIGDAAMAIYNAPGDLDEYVYKAVRTAWDILEGASQLREICLEKYGKEVTFGIGIHCGPAIVGNVGCEHRMDYTAIGDTVNTASRLEANAKSGQILISRDVYEMVKDYIKAVSIGRLALKGKQQEIETYQINGIIGKDVTA